MTEVVKFITNILLGTGINTQNDNQQLLLAIKSSSLAESPSDRGNLLSSVLDSTDYSIQKLTKFFLPSVNDIIP